jgi:hypothetical protein
MTTEKITLGADLLLKSYEYIQKLDAIKFLTQLGYTIKEAKTCWVISFSEYELN